MLLTKVITVLAAAIVAGAVKVDPLPAPTSIEWGNSGPKTISGGLWLDAPYHQIVYDAFNRMQQNARDLQWVPAATQAPFPSTFVPFPSETVGGVVEKRGNCPRPSSSLQRVVVEIADYNADLQLGVDESYTLTIEKNSEDITITAKTVWGAVHAFTTLQQIIISNGKGGLIVEEPVKIKDAPNYPHRGIMLDIARNFQTKKAVLRQIDAMSLSKLNVLHMHLTDTQSWPIQIPSFPEMTKDAYGPNKIYTPQDLEEVIQYARERAIRVIPEVDMPGHSNSGYAQLPQGDQVLACQNSFWSNDIWETHTSVEPNPGQLDILAPETYETVTKIYNDLSKIFKDNVFHVGMDELDSNCYWYSKAIVEYINSGHSWNDLAQYWIDHAVPIFKKVSPHRRLMMWEDAILSADIAAHTVPTDIIMQSWNGLDNIRQLASMGYDVVISNSDWFYLDCGFADSLSNDNSYNEMINPQPNIMTQNFGGNGGSWCGPYKSWQRIYDFDIGFNLTASEHKHVLGVEAPMWAEQVDDTIIDSKVWPRAAALAELAWSGNRDAEGNKRTSQATQRVLNFREYLVASGIGAAPLMPQWCLTRPHACDLYRNQTISNTYANNSVAV